MGKQMKLSEAVLSKSYIISKVIPNTRLVISAMQRGVIEGCKVCVIGYTSTCIEIIVEGQKFAIPQFIVNNFEIEEI